MIRILFENITKLKAILSKELVLNIFHYKKETEVHTYASWYGYSAIMLQKRSDGMFHPVLL